MGLAHVLYSQAPVEILQICRTLRAGLRTLQRLSSLNKGPLTLQEFALSTPCMLQSRQAATQKVIQGLTAGLNRFVGSKATDKLIVLLKEDVQKLGSAGDFVEVAPGFARNFLVPRKKATYLSRSQQLAAGPGTGVSASAVSPRSKSKRDADQLQQQEELGRALQQLISKPLEIRRSALTAGKLRASLKVQEIVEAARRQRGIDLPQALIQLSPDLTELGTHQVPLRCLLADGVQASLVVIIEESPATMKV